MNMEKVVKCGNDRCELYFGYSEKKTKCPFCHTVYVEVAEKETKDKKWTTKTQKESFKIWKDKRN